MKNTTLCYLEKDGAYLMLHRVKKSGDENAGKWIGVGGHFEEGESPFDCAVREIYEETGLAPAALSYRGVVTFVSDVYETEQMHLFTSDDFIGEDVFPRYTGGKETVTDCAEGNLAWVERGLVPTLPLWEGDKVFLSLLEKGEPFFSLKLVYTGDVLVGAYLNGLLI